MDPVASLDDLNRAAEAAGFAMADSTEDQDTLPTGRSVARATAVEDVARGARPPKAITAGALTTTTPTAVAPPGAVIGRLASGAHAVRDSVYGYLRFGMPA